MIFLFLLPPYLAVTIYLLIRFFNWLKNCNHRFDWKRFKIPFTVAYIAMALSPLLAFVLPKSLFAIVVIRIWECFCTAPSLWDCLRCSTL